MRRAWELLALLAVFIVATRAQDTTTQTAAPTTPWSGDPILCPNGPTTPSFPPKQMPSFAKRAEFGLEQIQYIQLANGALPGQKTMYEYIYDYDANIFIRVKNQNGLIDLEYYYYSSLTKATYYQGEFCVVENISQYQEMGKFADYSLSHRSLPMSFPRGCLSCASGW
jgi:hypothetical protein